MQEVLSVNATVRNDCEQAWGASGAAPPLTKQSSMKHQRSVRWSDDTEEKKDDP